MLVHGVADKQDSPGAIMICHHGFLEPSAGAQYFDRCVDLEESTQAVGHVVMVEANLFIWTENKTCAPLPAVAAKSIGPIGEEIGLQLPHGHRTVRGDYAVHHRGVVVDVGGEIRDRKSVVEGKRVEVSVDVGG